MIKNIVFDFGDIFINLDKKLFAEELQKIHISQESEEMLPILQQYEMGLVSTDKFLAFFEERLQCFARPVEKSMEFHFIRFSKRTLAFYSELIRKQKIQIILIK